MMYPLVGVLAGEGIPVTVTCGVLGFSTQVYHAWRKNPVCRRDWDDAHLINAAYAVHADDPEFGYRFIADELVHEMGLTASENRVQRLCSQQGIFSVIVRKRGSGKKAGPAVHDDLVNRDFTADAPDVLWLVDSVAALLPSRALDRVGKVVSVRDQGLLFQPDRRLLD